MHGTFYGVVCFVLQFSGEIAWIRTRLYPPGTSSNEIIWLSKKYNALCETVKHGPEALMPFILVVYPLNDWVIFFQYVILFPSVVQQKCDIFIWNWSNELNV